MPLLVELHNITNGCNKLFPADIDVAPGHEKYAVRCCDNGKSTCISPQPCKLSSTYQEAENICFQQGLNLCSRNDELNSICCKTGCEIDYLPMWIADDSKGNQFELCLIIAEFYIFNERLYFKLAKQLYFFRNL